MPNESTQPTPIDADEYRRFKQFVRDVHGTTRGNLRTELENALREYREGYYGDDRLARIENDVADLKSLLAEAEADGGRTPSSADSTDTHRDGATEVPADPPHPKASRQAKAEWLTAQFADHEGVHVDRDVRHTIADEYSFGEQATERLVDAVVERLTGHHDLEPHPQTPKLYVTTETVEAWRQDERNLADEELDTLDAVADD